MRWGESARERGKGVKGVSEREREGGSEIIRSMIGMIIRYRVLK